MQEKLACFISDQSNHHINHIIGQMLEFVLTLNES